MHIYKSSANTGRKKKDREEKIFEQLESKGWKKIPGDEQEWKAPSLFVFITSCFS